MGGLCWSTIYFEALRFTQWQRDLARQRPLPIRSSISESSTSAFLRDKNGYILELIVPVVQSISVATSHYEESLGASA
ncbi:hypothetical protein RIF29_46989 [Crotalaria pallida]|uniref:Uncharacterized protein n=1 Tax=Crotalaria pallida TaxID=3830 RepID=A0AAN9DXZ1_CROPI